MQAHLLIPDCWSSIQVNTETVGKQDIEGVSAFMFIPFTENLYESRDVIVMDNYVKRYVIFRTEENMLLQGWLYLPKESLMNLPIIAVKEDFIQKEKGRCDHVIKALCNTGFSVLLYDSLKRDVNMVEPTVSLYPYYW